MVKEHVDERQMHSGMSRPTARTYREAHQLAVKNVAESRFPFPTPEFPHFRAFVNEPEPEQKIFTNYGHELTPDIVVLQWPERLPVMIAEVVTPDMLTAENAETWAIESRLDGVEFFLYIPAGHAKAAKALLKQAKVKDVTLRSWRNIAGLRTVDVAPLK